MFKHIQRAVAGEYSGLRAKGYVAEITQYHRIQASPGYRAAAAHCSELLTGFGVSAQILTYPANEQTRYWSAPMFREWEALEAVLHLVDPEEEARKLADFAEVKCSLIQRSAPVDDLETEVLVLEDGEEEAEYQKVDVRGKVVLSRGDLERVRDLAVGRHGARGILYDGAPENPPVRQRIDLPDSRSYASFWWQPGDRRCFGFVLSPRQGEGLRRMVKSHRQEGKPPIRIRAKVVSREFDGQMEVVSALIPGETGEEVIVVAHLCHPQPSANDNASGCAAALELARTLRRLIEEGKLPRPKRGIRLLLVPEMTGTYAYLASHEEDIPHIVAGVNLDMVGQNQDLCGSVFIIESPPASMASFTVDLMERLRQEWLGGVQNPAASASYPLFRYTVTPFSGGSDHYILSDPSVGIPTPMLIQWPDRFWHTSEDTPDKVDPEMLAAVGGLAATYVYFVASCGAREVMWLGPEMLARFRARLAQSVQDKLTEALSTQDRQELALSALQLQRQVQFQQHTQHQAVHSLLRLAPQEERQVSDWVADIDRTVHLEMERARELLLWQGRQLGMDGIPSPLPRELDEWDEQAARLVPSRLFRGPLSARAHMHKLAQRERDQAHAWMKAHRRLYRGLGTVANYWVDGKRSIADIADLVELETGRRSVELLVRHFDLLAKLELVTVRDASVQD